MLPFFELIRRQNSCSEIMWYKTWYFIEEEV